MIMMPYGWTLAIAAAHRSGGLLAPHRPAEPEPAGEHPISRTAASPCETRASRT